ncbi:MAG TPA: hypothetical protein PLB74_01760 [Candidatus Paceibacterota bacterium]|nr:hypothetical protein [Candidatus Paceibacterota bacterium]
MEKQSFNQKEEEENFSVENSEFKEEESSDEPLEMTPDEFFEEFDKATAFQIMGQKKPKEQNQKPNQK